MVIRVSKPEFNLREKLTELDHPVGTHGSQIMKSRTISETANLVGVNRKNLLINGDFRIHQRGGTKTYSTGVNGYHMDMWFFHNSTNGTFTARVSSAAPNPPEVYHYLELECTAVDHSLTSGQYASITTAIEGYNFQQSMFGTPHAKPLTLSFYHRHTVPGVYSGVLRTAAANFNYVFEYEQSTGDAWEKAVVYIKPEGTQSYALGTGKALSLTFSMGDVTHLNDWVGQWFSHTYAHGSDRQINLFEDTSHKMRFTSVQLEVGSDATPFEQRSYEEELALCQRYFYHTPSNHYHFLHKNAYYESQVFYFPTTMRTTPDVSIPTPVLRRLDDTSNDSYSGLVVTAFPDGFYIGSSTTNNSLFYTWIMTGAITASAEL